MKKQITLSFSNTSAEFNAYSLLLNKINPEKEKPLFFLSDLEKSTKFIERLKYKFSSY